MSFPFLRATVLAAACVPVWVTAAPLTLDQALTLAVARSESTRSAKAGLASASEAARAADQLPDPVLQAGIDNLPVTGGRAFDPASDSMTQKRIGVSQEWLSADKRATRRAVADASIERESVAAQAAVADVRLQTALAYLDVHYANATLALAELMEHHAHEELEAAKGRVASAAGSEQEALGLAAARGAAEDDSAEVRQASSMAAASLRRWIGATVDTTSDPQLPPAPTEEDYVANAPAVRAARAALEVARRDAAATAANRSPNWTWQVSYGQRSGYADMVSVGVSIPLAIHPAERQDRETASKQALIDQADATLEEARRAADGEYIALTAEARQLETRIARVHDSVVTPAQQRTVAALAGYRGGSVMLSTLFEARHAEADARRKLLDLQRQLATVRARLAFKPLQAGSEQ